MDAHTQRKVIFLTGIAPSLDNVTFGPDVYRVPFLIRTVPKIEIVMMVTQSHKVLCSHAFIQFDQRVRIPFLRFPCVAEIFQTEDRRITKMAYMPVILTTTCIIHKPGIPVAVFGFALRPPMGPYSEFGIFKPLRTLPCAQIVPLGSELPCFYRNIVFCRHCQCGY